MRFQFCLLWYNYVVISKRSLQPLQVLKLEDMMNDIQFQLPGEM